MSCDKCAYYKQLYENLVNEIYSHAELMQFRELFKLHYQEAMLLYTLYKSPTAVTHDRLFHQLDLSDNRPNKHLQVVVHYTRTSMLKLYPDVIFIETIRYVGYNMPKSTKIFIKSLLEKE